jgi:hypothetical protein
LAQNGENQRKRENLKSIQARLAQVQGEIEHLLAIQSDLENDLTIAQKSALDLHDKGTEELERNINNIEGINVKVRANLDKDKAEEDALEYSNRYNALTAQLNTIRQEKIDLLNNAELPLPGLSVTDGELTYNGFKWDNMSGSDQLKVSVAIIRKLNPQCGFVLMDKLEQLDLDTLAEFGAWLESEDLQAIATRVSTGDECSLIISDGYVVGKEPEAPKFQKGVF